MLVQNCGRTHERAKPEATGGPAPALLGRRRELSVLDGVLAEVREGRSAVLVVRGEAGAGKTTLLRHTLARAGGLQVAHLQGAESEAELAFSGLHQVCAPHLDRLDRLPAPQRRALTTAFGLTEGRPPDRFLVGLAALTLLSDAAARKPLLCVVDDVQWLDTASVQALSIVARRLRADPIAMVFAAREETFPALGRLPELVLRGLDDHHARALLASALPGPMDERVRERILAEARGNPLALLELPRAASPAEHAGGYGVVGEPRPLPGRIERGIAARLAPLPAATRLLLLVAAADPVGEAALLWRAAEKLGVPVDAAEPAEAAELIAIGRRVRFRHPLVRSAVYGSATRADRRRAHAALAAAMDPRVDGEHRAWHRGQAANGPDEAIAAELEATAERARARGGAAAAAAFLTDATELTPDTVDRARRALAAAQAKLAAGAPEAALDLVAVAQAGPPEPLWQARIDLVRSQIAFATHRGRDAAALLLAAADRLRDLDPLLARETYVDALMASVFAGRLAWDERSSPAGIARAARNAPPAPDPPRAVDLLLDGLVVRFTEGYAAAIAPLTRAVREFQRDAAAGATCLRWHGLVARVSLDLWDRDSREDLAARPVRILHEQGELTLLPAALGYRAGLYIHSGRFDEAAALLAEIDAISQATGTPAPSYLEPVLAAFRGDERRALDLVRTSLHSSTVRGEGRAIPVVQYAAAVLHNSFGRYREALAATDWIVEHDDIGIYAYGLVERVEAAIRSGERGIAAEATKELVARADAADADLGFGIADRSRALLSAGAEAERLYLGSIERLRRSRIGVLQARTRLLYGEWLAAEARRDEAIAQLQEAQEAFERLRANGFADRARRALAAIGEAVHAPAASVADRLTDQERHIARLAADGQTNQEIATQLFLSPRTVEWHLGHVYAKLGVTSRRRLRAALSADPS